MANGNGNGNGVLIELAKQVPSAVVVLATVLIFTTHIDHRDDLFSKTLAENQRKFETAAGQCHDVQQHSTDAIMKLTEAVVEIKTTMHGMDATMRELRRAISKDESR